MYVILVNDDNSLYGSKKQRIMQRSKLVDNLVFIANHLYNGIDMTNATVVLEYLLPVSKKYKTEILSLSDERYKDCFLQYKLPIDTNITSEAGSVELQLTFAYADLDEHGNSIQRVRKTSSTIIEVLPITAWSDIIPDEALSSLDQRILKIDAQMRGLNELANAFDGGQVVDGLVYNETEDTLQLMANGVGVGNKVSVRDMLDDGTPVVDLDGKNDSDADDTDINNDCNCGNNCNCDCEDNVVEFDGNDAIKPLLKNNNIVEF